MAKKPNKPQVETARRRRRKPEAAESEILGAAEKFLRDHHFREMTVDEVMSRTSLSRPSFYEYFRDRIHLIIKLTERLDARNRAINELWFRGHETTEDLRRALHDIVELYVTEGHLLRALSDAAVSDKQAESSYRRMIEAAIEGTAQRIRSDTSRGAIKLEGLTLREIASALIWMTERYVLEKLGRQPQADPKVVLDTLTAIWFRVLYGVAQ